MSHQPDGVLPYRVSQMPPVIYAHRQIGWLTAGPVTVVLGFVVWRLLSAGLTVPALLCLSLLLLFVGLFGSLAAAVDSSRLRLRFGIGIIRKSVPIRTIRAFRIVSTHWFYGWGIRFTPRGWLWNVAGLEAVELDLDNGSHFTIGTDDPEGLVRALARARG